MRKYILGIFFIILSLSFFLLAMSDKKIAHPKNVTGVSTVIKPSYAAYARTLYNQVHLKDSGLTYPVFEKALTGFYNLKEAGRLSQHALLSIADFDQKSSKKRLYVLDLARKKIILNTWVAHGQRSGDDETVTFSNKNDSYRSSIGFYVTGEEYVGTHGRSLRLDGMDAGYNDNARMRAIVIHGAPYVSQGTIEALGRLGRSQGCPAVSPELSNQLISAMGEGSVLFINKSAEKYASRYLDEQHAALAVLPALNNSADQGQIHLD
ncbi:murein L,D-transpeptidase catalytic domain family protein [Pedobacter sp. PF22-3]|uniref:murein L,D-transpeptidase catalytic domain family protein n=1 Tax=Pedobacter sp. PF22-3 TaxID=2994467 RepID=UPI002248467B|nr:murein L,D-transpeptidase catalytic domain family protein [Pedobacter sp. PF22-3]MCX2492227.1 murein L,D-transpeptidase catalytic domain family protein [Pedobacter sp. PF22-3]